MKVAMTNRIERTHSALFKPEAPPSVTAICIAVCVYFFGALGVSTINHGFLLMAWLLSGFLAVTIYMTIEARGTFLNPYTMFFATGVLICLGGYILQL